jgi:hypothetical protein
MKRQLLCAAVLLLWPCAGQTLRADDDVWKDFRFLIGSWVSEAKPGAGSGTFTLQPDLEGKVLVRHNLAELPAGQGHAAQKHEDLMVIYAEHGGRQFAADYYDSEGHVIHYSVAPNDAGLVFTSSPAPGPRFRLTYVRAENNTVRVKFEIAPPGKATQFRTYLEGTVRRKG